MGESHLKEASLGRLYEDAMFTQGKLMSDRRTADLVGHLQPAMNAIKAAQAAENSARDHNMMSLGKLASAQSQCEEQFTLVYVGVQGITGVIRNNDAPLARLMFPGGLTQAKDLPAADMRREVKRMHAAIKENGLAEGLSAHLRPLADLEKLMEKAVNEQEQAKAALALAQSKSSEVREAYLKARAVLRGTLSVRFPLETRFVESFFRKERAKAKKVAQPPPAEAPVAAATTAQETKLAS